MWLLATLQIAVASAIATTFDDNIYLTAFFGEVDRRFRPAHVVVGELLGITVLIGVSLIGSSFGFLFARSTVGLLGLLPILIGMSALLARVRQKNACQSELSGVSSGSRVVSMARISPGFVSRRMSLLDLLRDRQTYSVSVVTISNGSNNLSIYIPLFASLQVAQLLVVIPAIYMAVIAWLMLSYGLTRMPGLSLVLNRYAKAILPFVLIWLGYRILSDSGSLALMLGLSPD